MGHSSDLLEAVTGEDLSKGLDEVVTRFLSYLKRYGEYSGKASVGGVKSQTMGHAVSSSTKVVGDGWELVLSQYSSHGGDPVYKFALMDTSRKAFIEGKSNVKAGTSAMNALFRRMAELINRRF